MALIGSVLSSQEDDDVIVNPIKMYSNLGAVVKEIEN